METLVSWIIKLCESAILVGQLRFVERVGGIEPPSPAWKAGVIAFIRYPLRYFFTKLLSVEIKKPTTNVQRVFPPRCFGRSETIVRAILFVNRSRPVL